MKRKYLWWVLLGLLALFTAVSCKSKPAPQEETPPPAQEVTQDTPDQASLDALNAAAARAAAARKLVMDLDGASYLPDDWKAAEAQYTAAEQQKKTSTRQEVQESTARYNKAADLYDGMTIKLASILYEYAVKELVNARNAAIAAGAETLVPDYLLDADNVIAKAVER